MKREKLEQSGNLALKHLRKASLEKGHPFMINSDKLPFDECYLEFPDGSIQLVTISRSKQDFKVVRQLSVKEQNSLRKTLQLA